MPCWVTIISRSFFSVIFSSYSSFNCILMETLIFFVVVVSWEGGKLDSILFWRWRQRWNRRRGRQTASIIIPFILSLITVMGILRWHRRSSHIIMMIPCIFYFTLMGILRAVSVNERVSIDVKSVFTDRCPHLTLSCKRFVRQSS